MGYRHIVYLYPSYYSLLCYDIFCTGFYLHYHSLLCYRYLSSLSFITVLWYILYRFLTLASLVIVTGLMYVVNFISPYGYKQSTKSKNSEAFNLFNSLWFCLASMLQQGADNTPRSLSGKMFE